MQGYQKQQPQELEQKQQKHDATPENVSQQHEEVGEDDDVEEEVRYRES